MSREFKPKNIWEEVDHSLIMDYGKRYMDFLDKAKTERLAVKEIVRLANQNGFIDYNEVMKKGNIKAGDKIVYNHKGKSAVLFVVGKKPIEDGMNIVGAHIDSPRLDIKQNPLYEDTNVALLKTHYYGGVKKYQWTTIPLELHGVVFTKDGKCVEISFGESDDEPVLYINDLLIHLSADQMEKKANKVIEAEQLNIVVGQIPLKTDDKDVKNKVKENILKILEEKYCISERDFATAELEIVPAGKSRSVGFDSSFIAGHGHDDRVCSYAGVEAIFNIGEVEKSAVCLLTDKEEVGSMGNTGMQSRFFENMVANLISLQGEYNDLKIRRAIENSQVLSADVNAAFDPTFPEVMEKLNAAKVAQGVTISKYTGSRGKSGSNDANAEFLSELRMLFDKNDVIWQTGELGKGDQGGGGTIAYILANLGAEVVDCGTAMHSMHAPIELVSKADAYMTMKAYNVFLNR
jgi:M18 family aminopeptidase